jgi:hypothetical protein
MSSNCEAELDILARDIAAKKQHVEDQTILVEVLERDGHEVLDQRSKLAKDRSELARQIVRQAHLLNATCTSSE